MTTWLLSSRRLLTSRPCWLHSSSSSSKSSHAHDDVVHQSVTRRGRRDTPCCTGSRTTTSPAATTLAHSPYCALPYLVRLGALSLTSTSDSSTASLTTVHDMPLDYANQVWRFYALVLFCVAYVRCNPTPVSAAFIERKILLLGLLLLFLTRAILCEPPATHCYVRQRSDRPMSVAWPGVRGSRPMRFSQIRLESIVGTATPIAVVAVWVRVNTMWRVFEATRQNILIMSNWSCLEQRRRDMQTKSEREKHVWVMNEWLACLSSMGWVSKLMTTVTATTTANSTMAKCR